MILLRHYLTLISRTLDRGAILLACSGLIIMVACVLFQIIARYIFSEPPAWTEELARYAMIWAGFSGATVSYRRGLDPVLLKVASLPQPWMRICARWLEIMVVSLFCCVILAATPQFFALHSQRLTEALEAPSIIIVSILPLSFTVIFFHALARAVGVDAANEEEK